MNLTAAAYSSTLETDHLHTQRHTRPSKISWSIDNATGRVANLVKEEFGDISMQHLYAVGSYGHNYYSWLSHQAIEQQATVLSFPQFLYI